MNTKKTLQLNKLGVCIKSKDTIVEYQNSACEEICGNQLGQKCEKGCILKLNADTSESAFKSGFKLFRNMHLDNKKVDTVIAQDGEKIITLIMSNEDFIHKQLELVETYNLSAAELNILRKFLEGSTHSQISAELFISKSTLRTHLNNIYKKIPPELKADILSRHFGNENYKK